MIFVMAKYQSTDAQEGTIRIAPRIGKTRTLVNTARSL